MICGLLKPDLHVALGGNAMHIYSTSSIISSPCSPVSTINCGVPTLASGVAVRPFNTTTVSSVIFYQCLQPDFIPSNESSVCGEDEMWSPDPSQVMCEMVTVTMPPPTPTGIVYLLLIAGMHTNIILL